MLGAGAETGATRRSGLKIVCLALLVSLFLWANTTLSQEKGGRDATPTKTTPKAGPVKAPRRPPPKPKLANLTVTVSPSDSTLLFDDQQLDKVDASGSARLTDLKTGQHTLTIRHAGYREKQQTVDLKTGENEPVSITLELLKGTLSVSPGVADAEISLKSIDANQGVGSYSGSISQVDFPPGEYEITVSKRGFKTVTRRFTIKPAESVYLEPQLETLVEKPRFQAPMSAVVKGEGKYLVVHLLGMSGTESPTSGSINVSVTKASSGFAEVSGTLTGSPCEVDLIRLDNVADASLVELPGPTNQWSRVVVRVRPKDSKHPVRFAINWRLLRGPSPSPRSRTEP